MQAQKYRAVILLSSLAVLLAIPCLTYAQEQNLSVKRLAEEIETLKNDPSLKAASWGVCVMNASTGEQIAGYNRQTGLVPASTMKIVSSAAALSILGKDFRFETRVEYDGTIDSTGILKGNIYITGGGDPTLGSSRFDSTGIEIVFHTWIKAVKALNIKKIEGAIIGDASFFDEALIPASWVWRDMGNYYGTTTAGLNINENFYNAVFNPAGKFGDPAPLITTEPAIPNVEIINNVKTGYQRSGDRTVIYSSPYGKTIFMEGTVPANNGSFRVKGSVPDPALLCASMFQTALEQKGIAISEPVSTVRIKKLNGNHSEAARNLIITTYSPKLEEIINQVNVKSINPYAEILVKMAGYSLKKKGNTDEGTSTVIEFWKSKGLNAEGLKMTDGSGLSPLNRVSPEQLANILRIFQFDKEFSVFYNSLPLAGKTGSLEKLFLGSAAENNLRAKSGYLSGVRAYAGYVNSKSGQLICFSVIVNNYDCSAYTMKKKLERLMIKIAELE